MVACNYGRSTKDHAMKNRYQKITIATTKLIKCNQQKTEKRKLKT